MKKNNSVSKKLIEHCINALFKLPNIELIHLISELSVELYSRSSDDSFGLSVDDKSKLTSTSNLLETLISDYSINNQKKSTCDYQ